MKHAAIAFFMILLLGLGTAQAASKVDSNCRYKGIPLYGKVKVVQYNANLKIKKVSSFPDLNVQVVKSFPDQCGKWQWVTAFPDFTVQFVDAFPDINIKMVNAFPGRP